MTKQEILDLAEEARKKQNECMQSGLGLIAIGALVLCLLPLANWWESIGYICLAAAILLFGAGLLVMLGAIHGYQETKQKVSVLLKELIVPAAVQPELEDCTLEKRPNTWQLCHKIGLPKHDIQHYGLSFTAKYHGRRAFSMTDLELIEVVVTETEVKDKDGNTHTETQRTEETVFYGQVFEMEGFSKSLPSAVRIRSNGSGFSPSVMAMLKKSCRETESIDFNHHYMVECDSDHAMFSLLTPSMIERMNNLSNKRNMRMLVDKDGRVYLAVNSGKWLGSVFSGLMPKQEQQIDELARTFRDQFMKLFAVFTEVAPDQA